MTRPMSPDTRVYLRSFYEINHETRDSGQWFGWRLSAMVDPNHTPGPDEDVFKFRSQTTAAAMAERWIRINRPDLVRSAEAEAAEARRYQAARRAAD